MVPLKHVFLLLNSCISASIFLFHSFKMTKCSCACNYFVISLKRSCDSNHIFSHLYKMDRLHQFLFWLNLYIHDICLCFFYQFSRFGLKTVGQNVDKYKNKINNNSVVHQQHQLHHQLQPPHQLVISSSDIHKIVWEIRYFFFVIIEVGKIRTVPMNKMKAKSSSTTISCTNRYGMVLSSSKSSI